jgi:23S rRNA pseudouridine955/2504/2580 synthase
VATSLSRKACEFLGRACCVDFDLNSRQIKHLERATGEAHYRQLDATVTIFITQPMSSAQTPLSASQITVDEESDGQRLDNFLIRELKGVPKTHIYRIIRSGEVRRNKGRVRADDRLQTGDVLRIPPSRLSAQIEAKAASPAPARVFPVVFEDEYFLVINKPAGVAVHGGSGVSFGVIEQMRQARPQAPLLELVHRLDRDTSGLLIIAKKKSVLKALQDQFRERETGKTYYALVKGHWPASLKVIDQPLHKFLLPNGERRVRVTDPKDPEGQRSISLVRVIRRLQTSPECQALAPEGFSLLAVTIKTGRTHQIRVHLSSQGHPILGDDKYGDFDLNRVLPRLGLKRMFLHAWQLRITHPKTDQAIELEAPMPIELANVCANSVFGL